MSTKKTIQNIENEQKPTFSGSWLWGFGFAMMGFFFSIFAHYINRENSISTFLVFILAVYIGIISILKLIFMSNTAYGWSGLSALIIGIISLLVNLVLVYFFKKR